MTLNSHGVWQDLPREEDHLPPAAESLAPRLRRFPSAALGSLLAAVDAVVILAAFLGGHWLRDPIEAGASGLELVIGAHLVALASVGIFLLVGLYDPRLQSRSLDHVQRLLRAWALISGGIIVGVFLSKAQSPFQSRLALAMFLTLGITGTLVVRLGLWRSILLKYWNRELRGARVIVGTGPLARRLARAGDTELRVEPILVGFVDDIDAATPWRQGTSRKELSAPFMGGFEVMRRLARERRITQVLVAREDLSRGSLVALAHQWMDEGLQVTLASSAFEIMVSRGSAGVLGGVPLVELRRSPQRGVMLGFKRLLDIILVGVGGALLLPLFGVIALAVRLGSPGPVLYRQERVGVKGRRFTMLKFRSMVTNNDDGHHRRFVKKLMDGDAVADNGDGEKIYKLVNDPRITPLGSFLRRTSLDELPQLWNVLRGDMSLVGPRPCLPYEWDLYKDWQRHRLDVVPGITGLWQVAGRSRVSFEDMVLLDLHYIANWSLITDLLLLARTAPVVLVGKGGH